MRSGSLLQNHENVNGTGKPAQFSFGILFKTFLTTLPQVLLMGIQRYAPYRIPKKYCKEGSTPSTVMENWQESQLTQGKDNIKEISIKVLEHGEHLPVKKLFI